MKRATQSFFLFLGFIFSAPVVGADTSWELIADEGGIRVFQKDMVNSEVVSFKGETIIPATPQNVFKILRDAKLSPKWIPLVEEKRDVRVINDLERIEYTHIGMPWPLTDRYFVSHAKAEMNDDGSIIAVIKSVDDPSVTEEDKVLGHLHVSKFVMTPHPQGTKMEIEVNSDPKGMIPKWLVNSAQKDWPIEFFTGLKTQLSEANLLRNTAH